MQITGQTYTYRLIETQFGLAVVRTEASGYELVWEIVGHNKRRAAVRLRHWQAA